MVLISPAAEEALGPSATEMDNSETDWSVEVYSKHFLCDSANLSGPRQNVEQPAAAMIKSKYQNQHLPV
jgi:hypothetical protein